MTILLFVLIFFVLALMLFAIPLEDIFFEYIPFYLNAIILFLFLSLIFVIIYIFLRKTGHINSFTKKAICLLVGLIVVMFSYDAYDAYNSVDSNRYTSVLKGDYSVDNQYKQLLPFYDDFYEINGDDAYYAFATDHSKSVDSLQISNRPYALKVNSSSYNARCFKSENCLLIAKLKFDNLINLLKDRNEFCEELIIGNSNDYVVKIYSNSSGYSAYLFTTRVVATIDIRYITYISLGDFCKIVESQIPLIVSNTGDGSLSSDEKD